MRAELFLRLGDSTRAREEWSRAAAADSGSVFVRVLRPVIGG